MYARERERERERERISFETEVIKGTVTHTPLLLS